MLELRAALVGRARDRKEASDCRRRFFCGADSDHVLTVPDGLIEDPGPAMLEAAELVFAKAYPELAR